MVTVKKAYNTDIPRILSVLEKFEEGNFNTEQCKILFAPTLLDEDGSNGLLLEDDSNKVVGFIGYAYSERSISNRIYQFCNIHSWIVDEEYRASSLNLLLPILKRKDVTITNFSPSPRVRELSKRLGFKTFDGTVIILPVSHASLFFSRPSKAAMIRNIQHIAKDVNDEEKKYIFDHSASHHRHALLKTHNGDCYVMMNRTTKKVGPLKLPFLRVHYISNPHIFANHIFEFLLKVAIPEKVVGLLVSKFLLRKNEIPFARSPANFENLYRPAEGCTEKHIDGLYSEMTQMNY